jgi:hypothetical protein
MLSLVQTGTVPFAADIDASALLNHLAKSLQGVHASTAEIQGTCVVFTRRWSRFVKSNGVLAPFESGVLTVDGITHEVRYRVSIRQLVLGVTGVVGLLTILLLMSRNRSSLLFVPLMWLWLVGGSLLIGILRFKRFVVRAVAAAPHETGQSSWTGISQE